MRVHTTVKPFQVVAQSHPLSGFTINTPEKDGRIVTTPIAHHLQLKDKELVPRRVGVFSVLWDCVLHPFPLSTCHRLIHNWGPLCRHFDVLQYPLLRKLECIFQILIFRNTPRDLSKLGDFFFHFLYPIVLFHRQGICMISFLWNQLLHQRVGVSAHSSSPWPNENTTVIVKNRVISCNISRPTFHLPKRILQSNATHLSSSYPLRGALAGSPRVKSIHFTFSSQLS